MTSFSTVFAIVVTGVILIPLFFAKGKGLRLAIIAIAVAAFFGSQWASQKYFAADYESWKFEQNLKQFPLYGMIKQHNPVEYEKFVLKVRSKLKETADPSVVPTYTVQFINEVFLQYLKYAPDEAIGSYLKATLDFYRYLATKDPRVIVMYEYEHSAEKVSLAVLLKDIHFQQYLARLLDAKEQIIMMAIKTPAKPPAPKDAEVLLEAILDDLAKKYGHDEVKKMIGKDLNQVPAEQVANFIIDFYTAISDAGPEKAGIIMRFIGNQRVPAAQ